MAGVRTAPAVSARKPTAKPRIAFSNMNTSVFVHIIAGLFYVSTHI